MTNDQFEKLMNALRIIYKQLKDLELAVKQDLAEHQLKVASPQSQAMKDAMLKAQSSAIQEIAEDFGGEII